MKQSQKQTLNQKINIKKLPQLQLLKLEQLDVIIGGVIDVPLPPDDEPDETDIPSV